ncbi:MAG: cytochrome c oxidase subunit II [Candidatus Nanopelagicales bacterium]
MSDGSLRYSHARDDSNPAENLIRRSDTVCGEAESNAGTTTREAYVVLKQKRRVQMGHEAEQGVAKKRASDPHLPGWNFGRRAGILAMGLVGAVALSGCANDRFMGMPEPATEEAPSILNMWQGSWMLAGVVGIFVWGLMLWAAVAYRRRKSSDVPVQTRYNMPIEALWTIAPLILVVGIFYFAATKEGAITKVSNDNVSTVDVVGYRWSWTFNYVNDDVYDVGQPAYAPNEKDNGPVPVDEGGLPTLWLPVNQKVKFNLTSPDVNHSFWVPAFLYKLDVIPGRTNTFEVTPSKLGTFAGKCAELCGVDHSRMLFNVKIVTLDEYNAHVNDLRIRGQIGQLKTDRTNANAQKV